MALYKLNKAEFSTILAALRYWQADGMGNPFNRSDDMHEIATCGDECVSLDAEAIDDLCESMNCGSKSPAQPNEPRAVSALRLALPELQSELEQRRDSGNDEGFEGLAAIVTECEAALAGEADPMPADTATALRVLQRLLWALPTERSDMAWQSMTADQKAERYDKAIADANALLAAAGTLPEPEAKPEPPVYGEGANLYIVKPHVDAWAIYEIRVRADSPEEARDFVHHASSFAIEWGEPEYSTFDHTDYEVYETDEDGDEGECVYEMN